MNLADRMREQGRAILGWKGCYVRSQLGMWYVDRVRVGQRTSSSVQPRVLPMNVFERREQLIRRIANNYAYSCGSGRKP